MVISISGMDGYGKTTQCKILEQRMPQIFSKPLHIKDCVCFTRKDPKEINEWWFNADNKEDFVDTMLHALAERRNAALYYSKKTGMVAVLDKGLEFYLTRIKATLLAYGTDPKEIEELLKKGLNKYKLDSSYEDIQFVISPQNGFQPKKRAHEQFAETEEIYSKYSTINTKLLNDLIKSHTKLTPVEFIENDPEKMSQKILKDIITMLNKDLQIPHMDNINDIVSVAKNIFGNNLKIILLAGSTAKGNYHEGWSDFDFYFIFDKINIENTCAFDKYAKNNKIHIGTTYYELQDMQAPLRIDRRTKATFYETNIGKNLIIYNPENITLPYIPFDDLQKYNEDDIAENINLVKRNLYSESLEVRSFIKRICLLEKIILKTKGYLTETYEDTFKIFAELYKIENIDISKFYDLKFTDNDKVKLREYGNNVLKVLQDERCLNLTQKEHIEKGDE